jgi:hypothetical protein
MRLCASVVLAAVSLAIMAALPSTTLASGEIVLPDIEHASSSSSVPVEPSLALRPSGTDLLGARALGDERADTGKVAAALPSPGVIRRCFTSLSIFADCVATLAIAACADSFTAVLKCGKRGLTVYNTYKKIQVFREDPACPSTLPTYIVQYLCRSRPPPAPRYVLAQVENGGSRLNAFTGPATWYPLVGSLPDGATVGVVCVAFFGQPIYRGDRVSGAWSRLTGGSFVPRIALVGSGGTVPFC